MKNAIQTALAYPLINVYGVFRKNCIHASTEILFSVIYYGQLIVFYFRPRGSFPWISGPVLLYCSYLDQIGIAGGAVDHAAGNNHIVSLLKILHLDCRFLGKVEQDVCRVKLLAQHRRNTPGKGKPSVAFFICRDSDYINWAAESGHHPDGGTGDRAGRDGFCVNVDRQTANRMRNAVYGILHLKSVIVEPLVVMDLAFRSFGNRCHHLYCLFRIFARGCFARKHNGGCAVIDCVCDV